MGSNVRSILYQNTLLAGDSPPATNRSHNTLTTTTVGLVEFIRFRRVGEPGGHHVRKYRCNIELEATEAEPA